MTRCRGARRPPRRRPRFSPAARSACARRCSIPCPRWPRGVGDARGGRSRGAEGVISPARRRCRFRPTIRSRRKSARSARAVPRQAPLGRRQPAPAPPATSAARALPTAGAGRGVPGRPLKRHTPTLWNLAWAGAGVLGRPRAQPRGAGRGPDRSPGRDGAADRRRVVARLAADPAYGARLRGGLSRRPAVDAGKSRQGDRDLRADAGVAADPLRPLDRRRRASAGGERDRRLPPVHRQGRLRQLPQRLRLHRLRLPRHRPARRRSRPRRGAAARGRRARIQDAGPARDRPLRSLHARRLARDARRTWCGTMQSGIVERPTLSTDLTRELDADRCRARRSHRLSRHADERGRSAAAATDRAASESARPRRRSASARCRRTTRPSIPTHIALPRGERLWIVNNDTRTHNIRVFDPGARLRFRRAGAGRDRRDRLSRMRARSWCSAASIRRWSFTSTSPAE